MRGASVPEFVQLRSGSPLHVKWVRFSDVNSGFAYVFKPNVWGRYNLRNRSDVKDFRQISVIVYVRVIQTPHCSTTHAK